VRFVSPFWLWCLLALPPVYWLLVRDEKRRAEQFARFAGRGLWRALVPELDPGARLRKGIIWCVVLAFVLVALARPQWGAHEETVKTTGLDIMVALDVSSSMEAEDVVPSRLKKARHLIKSMVDQLRGDRVGVVAFAASSYVAVPLTTDTDYVLETLSILGPKSIASQGTDIGIGLDTARKALDRGAEEISGASAPGGSNDAAAAAPKASRVIVLISDGEDQEEGALASAQQLREAGIKLYVIGLGTEKGAPVPVRDEMGNLVGHKHARNGEVVISKFRPDALMKVAEQAGGRYWNATPAEGELTELLKDVGALDRTEYAERKYLVYEERFQYPLALAVLLLLLEISLPARRIRHKPGRQAGAPAASASLALMLSTAALAGLAGVAPKAAHAASLLGRQPPVGAYIDNEKGIKAYKDNKLDEAERRFGNAQAAVPELPEMQYNQGLIQMQKGDADTAAHDFADSAKGAAEAGDTRLEGRSLFNLGGALAQKKDIPGAVHSYLGAIASAQRARDAELEADARRNLQLLIAERQRQKQQEKQDQKDKKDQQGKEGKPDPNGKQGDQDKKEQENKDQSGKNKDKGKDQPKRYEDPAQSRKRQFKSVKLSKDDAERVMAELSNRERELQSKLKKQPGTPQSQAGEKDW
jgi:Ca-activated chloride channel family protein